MAFPVRTSAPGRRNLQQPPETQLLPDTNSFTEATDSTESDHNHSRRCLQSGTGSARVPRSPSSPDIPIFVSAPTPRVETVRSENQSSVSRRLSSGPSLPGLLLERRPHSRSPLCASQQTVRALSSPFLEPAPQSPHLHCPSRLPPAGLCAGPSSLSPGTLVWVPARCLVPDNSATASKGSNRARFSASNDGESFPFLAPSLRRAASPQACRDAPSSSGGCAAAASPPALLHPSSSAEETPSSDGHKKSRKRLLYEDQSRDQSLRRLGNADRSQPDFRASERPFYPAEVVAAHAVRGFGVRTPHAGVYPRLRHESVKTGESSSPEAGGDPSFVQVRLCRGTESNSNPRRGETKGDGLSPDTGQEFIAPVRLSGLLLRDATLGAADDNAQMQHLNEANLVANLRCRFLQAFSPVPHETAAAAEERQRKIYTYTGTLLIAVNPYRFFNLYDRHWIARFDAPSASFAASLDAGSPGIPLSTEARRNAQKTPAAHAAGGSEQSGTEANSRVVPHPFGLAEFAYCRLVRDRRSQSILISGESGAGKTETSKHVLTYLAAVSDRRHGADSQGLEARLLQSGPVLEAFGNAHTVLNVNSSRFGKMLLLHFTARGKLTRASVATYLLANERVVRIPSDEFSFHIFYALCNAAVAAATQKSPAGEGEPEREQTDGEQRREESEQGREESEQGREESEQGRRGGGGEEEEDEQGRGGAEEGMEALLKSLFLENGVEEFRLLTSTRESRETVQESETQTRKTNGRQNEIALCPWSDLRRITAAMETVGISGGAQADIFKLLAAILHLGNVEFTTDQEPETSKKRKLTSVSVDREETAADRSHSSEAKCLSNGLKVTEASRKHLKSVARLLGLPRGVEGEEMLRLALVSRSVRETRSFFDLDGAAAARDAACKTLYSRAFDAVVARINAGLQRSTKPSENSSPDTDSTSGTQTIGILDIFGFEDLRNHSKNRLEQLCINYANERLHCFLLQQLILNEHVLYTQEGVFENQDCPAFPFSTPLASTLTSSPSPPSPFSHTPSFRSSSAFSTSPSSLSSSLPSLSSSLSSSPPVWEGRPRVSDMCGRGEMSNGERLLQTSGLLCALLAGSALTGDLRCLLLEERKGNSEARLAVARVGTLLKTPGLFGLLEEAGRLPAKGNRDVLFCSRLLTEMKAQGAETFIRGTKMPALARERLEFTVSHFACDVTYDARDFCRANREATSDELERLFHACTTYTRLVAGTKNSGARASSSRRSTLSVQFASQLQQVLKALQETSCHFIRCVKPNRVQEAGVFEEAYVHRQLRCSGMPDLLRVMADGFPCRLPYVELWRRYETQLPRALREALNPRDFASLVLEALCLPRGSYRLGSSLVFFRLGCLDTIDELLGKKSPHRTALSSSFASATQSPLDGQPRGDQDANEEQPEEEVGFSDAYSRGLVHAVLAAHAERKRRRVFRHVRLGAKLRLAFAKQRASRLATCCAVRVYFSLHPRRKLSAAAAGLVAALRQAAVTREDKRRERLAQAATILAASARGYLARKRFRRLRDELFRKEKEKEKNRREAAIVLQKVWRGALSRRKLREQHAAAVAIQRHWWGFRNRRGKHFFFLQLYKLQRAVRRWLRRRWREREKREVKEQRSSLVEDCCPAGVRFGLDSRGTFACRGRRTPRVSGDAETSADVAEGRASRLASPHSVGERLAPQVRAELQPSSSGYSLPSSDGPGLSPTFSSPSPASSSFYQSSSSSSSSHGYSSSSGSSSLPVSPVAPVCAVLGCNKVRAVEAKSRESLATERGREGREGRRQEKQLCRPLFSLQPGFSHASAEDAPAPGFGETRKPISPRGGKSDSEEFPGPSSPRSPRLTFPTFPLRDTKRERDVRKKSRDPGERTRESGERTRESGERTEAVERNESVSSLPGSDTPEKAGLERVKEQNTKGNRRRCASPPHEGALRLLRDRSGPSDRPETRIPRPFHRQSKKKQVSRRNFDSRLRHLQRTKVLKSSFLQFLAGFLRMLRERVCIRECAPHMGHSNRVAEPELPRRTPEFYTDNSEVISACVRTSCVVSVRAQADTIPERGGVSRAPLSLSSGPLGSVNRRHVSSPSACMRLHAASSPAACGAFEARVRQEGDRLRPATAPRGKAGPSASGSRFGHDPAAPCRALAATVGDEARQRRRERREEDRLCPVRGRRKSERESYGRGEEDSEEEKTDPESWGGETAFLPSSEGEEESSGERHSQERNDASPSCSHPERLPQENTQNQRSPRGIPSVTRNALQGASVASTESPGFPESPQHTQHLLLSASLSGQTAGSQPCLASAREAERKRARTLLSAVGGLSPLSSCCAAAPEEKQSVSQSPSHRTASEAEKARGNVRDGTTPPRRSDWRQERAVTGNPRGTRMRQGKPAADLSVSQERSLRGRSACGRTEATINKEPSRTEARLRDRRAGGVAEKTETDSQFPGPGFERPKGQQNNRSEGVGDGKVEKTSALCGTDEVSKMVSTSISGPRDGVGHVLTSPLDRRKAPGVCESKIPSPSLFVTAMQQKRRKIADFPAAQ
ncbi:UNVERIFIED_CONTAM: myosin K [Hammondia hammondi]|eukprot:XP_008886022.1 myosin K [Hammondia hammondi]